MYATLDDVPEFVTTGLQQLEAVTIGKFTGYHGMVLYGPQVATWPIGREGGHWGRSMVMPSHEGLQMRFAPKEIISPGGENASVVLFATRLVGLNGQCEVRVTVLFRPGSVVGGEVSIVDTQPRIVGCKGLHVIMAGLFKRHNPQLVDREAIDAWQYDARGYQALRSTTYSVHATGRNMERSSDHINCTSATPGPSVMSVAGEIVDARLPGDQIMRRGATPIAAKQWKDLQQHWKDQVHMARGPEAGDQAIASACAIIEMLSAEGIVGMRAHPFFEGALPDRISGPHGPALCIAMALRLAIFWDEYGLRRPSKTDMVANDQFRMIWCTAGPGPLPMMQSKWAIDVVLMGALKTATGEADNFRRKAKLREGLNMVDDQKVFWQRVGQRLITSTFGLGASIGSLPENEYGKPWRCTDKEQLARDRYLLEGLGCSFEGVDSPLVNLASASQRKTALVKMVLDVENWLRTGKYKHAQISPPNDSPAHQKQLADAKLVIGELVTPHIMKDLATRVAAGDKTAPDSIEQAYANEMQHSQCLSAHATAISDCKQLILHGPMHHFTYCVGSYVVAPSQTSPCSECDTAVHVLQGVMFNCSYGECTACHAKRCFDCTIRFAKSISCASSDYVGQIGRKCRRCGAEPAKVSVVKTEKPNGGHQLSVCIAERAQQLKGPTKIQSTLRQTVPVASGGSTSHPAHTHVQSKKDKRKGRSN